MAKNGYCWRLGFMQKIRKFECLVLGIFGQNDQCWNLVATWIFQKSTWTFFIFHYFLKRTKKIWWKVCWRWSLTRLVMFAILIWKHYADSEGSTQSIPNPKLAKGSHEIINRPCWLQICILFPCILIVWKPTKSSTILALCN